MGYGGVRVMGGGGALRIDDFCVFGDAVVRVIPGGGGGGGVTYAL
jgi:hypothetical protein